jgi:hypothetical protein
MNVDHAHHDFNIIENPRVVKIIAQREPFHGAKVSATSPTFSETLSATHTRLSKYEYRYVFLDLLQCINRATNNFKEADCTDLASRYR